METKIIKHHKDGGVAATGQEKDGLLEGYWEWFRVDGTKKRSGYFRKGIPVGEWITYDKNGNVYKITHKG
ncbi:MAG: hypothetical protein ACFFF4_16620 [Candidatus Thorarchaeota archaeon]